MAAYFTCWEPRLGLNPNSDEFPIRLAALLEAQDAPSARMDAFAEALLARFPDLSSGDDVDTVWNSGPFKNQISGGVVYFGVIWSKYDEARLFIRPMARKHGLDFYDHQSDLYIPAPGTR